MKMILAIINQDDANTVVNALMQEGYSVTKLSTTGGFLRAGNMTILIGVEDEKVPKVLNIIHKQSHSRRQYSLYHIINLSDILKFIPKTGLILKLILRRSVVLFFENLQLPHINHFY